MLQGMTPIVIYATVSSIVVLLGFTVWQRMRAIEVRSDR